MSQDKAIVRELIERVEGVTGTWFELEIEGHNRKKTLVVEVDFDLDPHTVHFSRGAIDEIVDTFSIVRREESADRVSKLKIVSKAKQSAEKRPADNERRPSGGAVQSAPRQ